ncbi:MAG: ATP-dependent endonuclease [Desulfobacter sp.]
MYISKIFIKGFRSFGPIGSSININNKISSFIGLNSSGKTAALEALRKVFSATNTERELKRQDFHIEIDEDHDKIIKKDLSIEVKINFDDSEKEPIPHFFNHMVIDGEGENPYLRIRLESNWVPNTYSQEGDIDSNLYFLNIAEGEKENEDSKRIFPKHLRGLIQILYVPAIRKPADQIKYVSGSILYRVLRLLKFDDKFKSDFETKIEGINTLFSGLKEFSAIQTSLTSFWKQFHKDYRYEESNLCFGNSDLESILKKLEVSFSPTGTHRSFQVDDLGEGYRSLFYLTLVCALLEVEEQLSESDEELDKIRPVLTILAIEEPENHIAPQLLGRVINILKSLSQQKKSQVFLSSHTPAIIKRIDPESIFHFRIEKNYTTAINAIALPSKKDEAYKYVKEAVRNYPEIYFAKLVVIGEGDSEEVIFNRLMDVYDVDFDDNIVTFAPLGHRFVNHIWRLLGVLKIPHITLLDLDVERNGGGWGRIKYALNQLIKLGVDKNQLLKLKDGTILSDDSLDKMHTRIFDDNKLDTLMPWVDYLETYNVFYSTPLDLDFLLLQHYSDTYKKAIPKGGGPQIPDKILESAKFDKKLETSIQATLKSEDAKGLTYSELDKELMIWYNYHFLGRGKPVTHINALSLIADSEIKASIPPVFDKIFSTINKILTN